MRPRVGDSVWLQGPPDRNGSIIHIDWSHDKEVIVGFDNDEETVEFHQFDNFNEAFNQWLIYT